MSTNVIDRLIAEAKQHRRRVVFPEGTEVSILIAARRLLDEGIADITLLGEPAEIDRVATDNDVAMDGITVVDPNSSERAETYAQLYHGDRDRSKLRIAQRAVRKPLYFGAMMVRSRDAEVMVAGIATPTRRVIEAAILCVGLAEGISTASSYFLMCLPGVDEPLVFADCAVNVNPSAGELAEIAVTSAASAVRLLRQPPRVAMLSFSTRGSADHHLVDKVTEALRLASQLAPGLAIDGEFQADSALVPAVAARKVPGQSEVAGQANVLIFPDLNSGNIAYKLTQYLAKAQAIGPILQGFAQPVADLSRGASVDDVVATTVVMLSMSNPVSTT